MLQELNVMEPLFVRSSVLVRGRSQQVFFRENLNQGIIRLGYWIGIKHFLGVF